MELIDIKYFYDSGNYAKTIESRDVFLLGRPNSQRGDKYSVLVINQVDLISQIIDRIPTPPVVQSGAIQLLGSLTQTNGNAFNVNTTADQLITLSGGSKFIITDYVFTNVSTKLTNALDFEVFDAASRGGNQIISSTPSHGSDQVPAIFDNPGFSSLLFMNKDGGHPTLVNPGNIIINSNTIYASMGTPQGGLATADVYIYGYILK